MRQLPVRDALARELQTYSRRIGRSSAAVVTQAPDFSPVRVLEIEIGNPLPPISACDEKTGQRYEKALCLVRLHSEPLGLLRLQLDGGDMNAHTCAQQIWTSLGALINAHLQQDGLTPASELDAAGLHCSGLPRCIDERNRFSALAPFASIIVATRDRPQRLQACLHSLVSLDYPQYEILVVDNAPGTGETVELIRQTYRDVPQVRYIREDHPGASWARNRGIMAAKGEILAFTDDDVVVDPHWLLALVRGFRLAGDVACVTGLALPYELETPAQFWFEEHEGLSERCSSRVFDMQEHHPQTPLYPYTTGQVGTGSNMAFTAAFLRSVGGFDPALGPGSKAPAGEELALFFQVITAGHKLVYTPAALLYHLHRRDYADLRRQIYSYGVGLTAYLTKCALGNPRLLFDLLTKVPYGLYHAVSPRSHENSARSAHYPKDLTILELKGMLHGPLAYVRSRWALARALRATSGRETLRSVDGKGKQLR
jgi:glycosyltransferase involved in cell wall biosynthesis